MFAPMRPSPTIPSSIPLLLASCSACCLVFSTIACPPRGFRRLGYHERWHREEASAGSAARGRRDVRGSSAMRRPGRARVRSEEQAMKVRIGIGLGTEGQREDSTFGALVDDLERL